MEINFFDFNMDQSVIAPIIYNTNWHQTTNKGVVLSDKIIQELKRFLLAFNVSVEVEQTPYYRIDAYFDTDALWILEINASFVDGWGTALNLARASDIVVDPRALVFPRRFATKSLVYLPELQLFLNELSVLGINDCKLCDWNGKDLMYVYGRVGQKDQLNILPYDGLRLDNKLNLGLFSRIWSSDLVKIPQHHISRFDDWENVPVEVVIKFCDKSSAECERARQSVIFNKPSGKAPFIRRCYNAETLLAQNLVKPAKVSGRNCQLVILAIGNEPITGYVQYSRSEIINDDSIHGPLQIS